MKVGLHVLQRERAYGLRRGLAQTRIILRKQHFSQPALRQMARAVVARLDHPGHLSTHYVQRLRRQRGVQFVLRQ